MAWLRIDDRVRTHPKIAQAGPAAAWLWFCGVCYCREHLTDGFIPKAVLPALALSLTQCDKHAKRLVEVNLWHTADGGYQVHDFLDWNPSRDEVESGREWDRQRKDLYRDKDVTSAIRHRDGDQCRYCGGTVNWNDRRGPTGGQFDHVIPRGPSTFDNVVVSCRQCNGLKRNRTPDEAGMPLRPESEPVSGQVGTSSGIRSVTSSPSRAHAGAPARALSSVGSGSENDGAENRDVRPRIFERQKLNRMNQGGVVPLIDTQFGEFVSRVTPEYPDRLAAYAAVLAWMNREDDAALARGRSIPGDPFKWWQARFDAWKRDDSASSVPVIRCKRRHAPPYDCTDDAACTSRYMTEQRGAPVAS